jgi:hypothetical protein
VNWEALFGRDGMTLVTGAIEAGSRADLEAEGAVEARVEGAVETAASALLTE